MDGRRRKKTSLPSNHVRAPSRTFLEILNDCSLQSRTSDDVNSNPRSDVDPPNRTSPTFRKRKFLVSHRTCDINARSKISYIVPALTNKRDLRRRSRLSACTYVEIRAGSLDLVERCWSGQPGTNSRTQGKPTIAYFLLRTPFWRSKFKPTR